MTLNEQLEALGLDLPAVLEHSSAPVALVDSSGVVLWQNAAADDFVGDQRGKPLRPIADEYLPRARAALTRKRMGADRITHAGVVVVDRHGARQHAETISLSLMKDDQLVAILSIVKSVSPDGSTEIEPLSPRQRETLALLAAGLTTAEIATQLGGIGETVSQARSFCSEATSATGRE